MIRSLAALSLVLAAVTKALADPIAYCDAAYAALDDRKASELVAAPFGSGKAARASALMSNTGHLREHYGNLVTYLRIKRHRAAVVWPGSSRRARASGGARR